MVIKNTSKHIEPKRINAIKYMKLHTAMFDAIEEYMKEVYPEWDFTGIKILADRKK